jgi:hypothetical protein
MTPIQHIKEDTLILADQAEEALEQIRESVKEFITDKCHPEKSTNYPGCCLKADGRTIIPLLTRLQRASPTGTFRHPTGMPGSHGSLSTSPYGATYSRVHSGAETWDPCEGNSLKEISERDRFEGNTFALAQSLRSVSLGLESLIEFDSKNDFVLVLDPGGGGIAL